MEILIRCDKCKVGLTRVKEGEAKKKCRECGEYLSPEKIKKKIEEEKQYRGLFFGDFINSSPPAGFTTDKAGFFFFQNFSDTIPVFSRIWE